ncbi:MAG: polysaccharide deacetylase family protein [Bacteroidota bacterium]
MLRLFRPPRWIDWVYPSCTWRFVVSDRTVFLTFDDGPHPDITPFVLEQLATFNMKATFFCVGENMVRYPELVNAIREQGHHIGNHTMRHTKGTSVTNEEYLKSVQDFDLHFHTELFRPPYGKMRWSQRQQLKQQFRIIMWSWLSYDYDSTVSVETILKRAQKIKKGDIIVLHDNPKITERQQELLPQFLQLLQQKNFRSVVIPPLVSDV